MQNNELKFQPTGLKEIFPDGDFIATPYKEVFKIKNEFSLNEKIGIIEISEFFNFKNQFPYLISILGKNENLKNFKFEQLLFLDVETTGYKFSTGNMIFLIGLGFFDKNNFIIEQYFIEDPLNEMALLFILEKIFKEKSHIITFNGRSFDFYVIKNRFGFVNKFEFYLDNFMNFDLLYSSRKLWDKIIKYMGLQNIEKKFLKIKRSDEDIDGALIPIYYKTYLKFYDANIVKSIFYHNLMDVYSMLALLILQLKIVTRILNYDYPENINYSSTAQLFKNKDKKIYKDLLLLAYNKGELNVAKELYLLYKREKKLDKGVKFLNDLINLSIYQKAFDYFPYRELAVYYERYKKEHLKAYELLNEALKRVGDLSSKKNEKIVDDIIKRIERLKKKAKIFVSPKL